MGHYSRLALKPLAGVDGSMQVRGLLQFLQSEDS